MFWSLFKSIFGTVYWFKNGCCSASFAENLFLGSSWNNPASKERAKGDGLITRMGAGSIFPAIIMLDSFWRSRSTQGTQPVSMM